MLLLRTLSAALGLFILALTAAVAMGGTFSLEPQDQMPSGVVLATAGIGLAADLCAFVPRRRLPAAAGVCSLSMCALSAYLLVDALRAGDSGTDTLALSLVPIAPGVVLALLALTLHLAQRKTVGTTLP